MAIWEILEAKVSRAPGKKVSLRKSCKSTLLAVLKSELAVYIFIKIHRSTRLQIINFEKAEKQSVLMFKWNYFNFVILQIIIQAELSFTSEF